MCLHLCLVAVCSRASQDVPGLSFGVSGDLCVSWPYVCLLYALGPGVITKLGVSTTGSWLVPRLPAWRAIVSEGPRVSGCVGGWRVGRDPGRLGGERRAGPGAGRTARAGGGAARQLHFGEVGGSEPGPGRARSPGKEGGGRVAAGRHGAGDPGPPSRPAVAAATTAVRAGAPPISAASGTWGYR